ncbi:MAG: von Willebrand factor type A domain-containing protein [Bacteriovoracaceae bacterium]|nr:von Willebrand factor type A domain-containing protein [Bacteriovoracaceae bacterium]
MTNLSNDPRLTAYALGELDPLETKEFEMELKNDPNAQKEVDDIKNSAILLKEGLESEDKASLGVDRVEEIHANTTQKKSIFDILKSKFVLAGLPALAASILIVLNISKNENAMLSSKVASSDSEPMVNRPQVAEQKAVKKNRKAKMKKEFSNKLDLSVAGSGGIGNQLSAKSAPSRSGKKMVMSEAEEIVMPSTVAVPQFGREGFIAPPSPEPHKKNTEDYDKVENSDWVKVSAEPLSTFSIDVDTASYSNMRRFLNNGNLPPLDSVRIEEFINYFDYDYEGPSGKLPFAVNFEQSKSPWNPKYKLVKIGLKGKEIAAKERPNSNLVFLLDVSGSMNDPNKLPLLKNAMKLLTRKLNSKDRVSIVVYAGASGMVLPSTSGSNKAKILQALTKLNAGGSTNGGQGIELAYKVAKENYIDGGVNRVILATDGDFNVGNSSRGGLIRLIEEKAKSNIFLTVLGLGMGNYKDGMLEKLADKGNGNYAYLDTLNEAKKVLIHDMNSTLITIAKDVKIQVEFNPNKVSAYRLIGYENRKLAAKDFNDDKKDAGEIGAGHTVTAFYEIVPAGVKIDGASVDALKYQKSAKKASSSNSKELMTVKLRYKEPTGSVSTKLEFPLKDETKEFSSASKDFKFATSVATFGMILRKDMRVGEMSIQKVIDTAKDNKGEDPYGYRQEFIENVELARELYKNKNQ